MKPITDTREIHDVLFGILKAIRDFCDANGLRYSLSGGTLLGAVRYQDFIPWDDDADIAMPREDMERFCREFKSPRYEVCTAEKDPAYLYLYPKVSDSHTVVEETGSRARIGLFIDVYPVDAIPFRDYRPQEQFLWKVASHLMLQKNVPIRKSFRKASLFFGLPFRVFPNWCYTRILARLCTRHNAKTTPYMGFLTGSYGLKDILPRSVFEATVPVTLRGETFSAMSGWREYLTSLYGEDFMTPPPPEKRVSRHSFRAWWK